MYKRSAKLDTGQKMKTIEESELKFVIEDFAAVTRSLATNSTSPPWESQKVILSSLDAVWWANVYTCFQEFDPFGLNLYPYDYKYCRIVIIVEANPKSSFDSVQFLAKAVTDEIAFLHAISFKLNNVSGKGKVEREYVIHEDLGPCSMKLSSLVSSESPLRINLAVSVQTAVKESKKFKSSDLDVKDARKSEIVADVGKMLNDPKYSDFTFFIKGTEFKVHRNILAATSEVFAKLFTVKEKNATIQKCNIRHTDPTSFDQMLHYIYTGSLRENLNESGALGLFICARFFGIKGLKMVCEQKVLNGMNKENAVKLYKKALAYGLDELKEKSWTIIKRDLLKIDHPLETEPLTSEQIDVLLEKHSLKQEVLYSD